MKFALFILMSFILTCAYAQDTTKANQNALKFDGINDYATIDNLKHEMAGLTNFTVEFWMIADKNQQTSNIRVTMFAVNDAPFLGDNTFLISMGGMNGMDGHLIIFDGITGFDIVGSRNIGDNQCHHIAYVRNGNIGTAYIDGTIEATHTADFAFDTTKRYSIGHEWDNATPSDFYNGKIDDLRIWSNSRTSSELNYFMNSELFGNEPNLISYYNFNQGIPGGNNAGLTTIIDLNMNNNIGHLYNFALNGLQSNWISVCQLLDPANVNELENSLVDAVAFPNPSSGLITILSQNKISQIEVYTVTGNLIHQSNCNASSVELNLSEYNSGVYFIKISSEQNTQYLEVIRN
jgi:hypothetical protein